MRKPKDRNYQQITKALEFNGHASNYCVTAAACAVSGLSAGKVVALAKRHVDGFTLGKGMTISQARDLLEAVYAGDDFVIQGGEYNTSNYEGKQFRSVVKELCEKGGRHIIITMNSKFGHASAIRDGKLVDHYDAEQRQKVKYVITVPGRVQA